LDPPTPSFDRDHLARFRAYGHQPAATVLHVDLSIAQIYAETSLRALGDNYIRALGGMRQLIDWRVLRTIQAFLTISPDTPK
jgi:hypothetical protein